MESQKSFKFRIYPTKEQEKFLTNQFGGVRFIYNFFLNRRKQEYLINKKSSNYYKDAKQSGSGMESDLKQKLVEALPSVKKLKTSKQGKSMKQEIFYNKE